VTNEPERTAVYRVFGEEHLLLYIGMTNSIPIRWNGHEAVQPWWDELRSLTVEWYESRPEADAAEEAAIRAERPKYNVTYLKPSLVKRGERKRQEPAPVDWENFEVEPRADDEDLLEIEGIAKMTQMTVASLRNALKYTEGPEGFTIWKQPVFRRGEIRRWIAAIEASQRRPRRASGDTARGAA
jgi:hypothetical protein